MLLKDGRFAGTSTAKYPIFIYDLSPNKDFSIWKLYSPCDKDNKWLSWGIQTLYLENPPQFKYKKLVILSSKKDKMVFDNLSLQLDTTALLAEGNITKLINNLGDLDYYDEIFALLDFDSAEGVANVYKGVERTKQLEEKSGGRIKGLYLPENINNYLYMLGIKDIEEIFVKLGNEQLKSVVDGVFRVC